MNLRLQKCLTPATQHEPCFVSKKCSFTAYPSRFFRLTIADNGSCFSYKERQSWQVRPWGAHHSLPRGADAPSSTSHLYWSEEKQWDDSHFLAFQYKMKSKSYIKTAIMLQINYWIWVLQCFSTRSAEIFMVFVCMRKSGLQGNLRFRKCYKLLPLYTTSRCSSIHSTFFTRYQNV